VHWVNEDGMTALMKYCWA